MRKLVRNAWSLLIGFLIFGVCLVLPIIGWTVLMTLICWIIGLPVVAFIEGRFFPSR